MPDIKTLGGVEIESSIRHVRLHFTQIIFIESHSTIFFSMSNSILSLIFPLSGEKCTNMEYMRTSSVTLPLQTIKIFGPSQLRQSQLCTIVSKIVCKKHVRSLIFQSFVSKAREGESVTILTCQKWTEIPFGVQKSGVHNMPKLELTMFDRLTFVFPKNYHELFLYVSAVGALGAENLPDLLIIENVEDLLSKNVDESEHENRMDLETRLMKLFSMLANFSKELLNKKMIRIIVTSSDKSLQSSFEKYNVWCDEVWCLCEEDDEEMVLRLHATHNSGVQLRFSFEPNLQEYSLSSLSVT